MRVYRKIRHGAAALRRLGCGRGASALEYGIILPVFLAFLLGIMDTGRLLWTYSTLHRATDVAARCAAVNTTLCGTTAQIQNQAANAAWGMTISPAAFTVATTACGAQVSVSYEFTFVTPGLTTLSLAASSCYPA